MKLSKLITTSLPFILLMNISLDINAVESPPDAQLVSISKVTEQNMTPAIWLPGNVTNRLKAQLSSEKNGRLIWIKDIGIKVKKGQAVAKLDSQEEELLLAEKHSQLNQQKINQNYLLKQQQRLQSLLLNKSTPPIELDRVEKDLAIASEELDNLKIQIKRINLSIERATIRAPFDGRINQRMAQQGEFITVGEVLVQLVDPRSIDISVAAPLNIASFLKRGDKMLVKWGNNLESFPIRTWSPAGNQNSRTFEVILDASNISLMGGNAVSVSLPRDMPNVSTMVPRDALILRQQDTFVMTVDKQNNAHQISVIVGAGAGSKVSVNGNIEAGENVVIRGAERLKDGQKVRYDQLINQTSKKVIAAS